MKLSTNHFFNDFEKNYFSVSIAWKCMNSKNKHNIVKRLFGYFLVFILLFALSFISSSQDVHFTLFNNAPLLLNPANTGNFDGNWRITGNYRDQWRALSDKNTFTTASFSFDGHFYILNQKLAAGIYFINDRSGSRELISNKLYLSVSYEKLLSKNLFRFGLQTGYVFRSFGSGGYTLPSDWNIDEGSFVSEGNPIEKSGYLDINIGALWKTSINKLEPEVGISLAHCNFPNESFYKDSVGRLPIRSIIHGKVKARINDKIYLRPTLVYVARRSATEFVFGSDVGFNVFDKHSALKEILVGVYFRDGLFKNSDAVSLMGGARIGRIDISICYDYNISRLKVATGNKGGIEISFAYRSISTVLNSYSIPCERF